MSEYTAKNITILEGLEAVRKRPGMYVGETPILQMLFEAIDNAIDEFSMGYGKNIEVKFLNDYYVIIDDGRGIPCDIHESGKSALEVIMTTLHAGGKFDENSYKCSGGLHGVGISVTNALSKWLEVEVYRDGNIYLMKFEKGIVTQDLEIIGSTDKRGTKISFSPDFSIIDSDFPIKQDIENRLKELSYLNKGLSIVFEFNEHHTKFCAQGGILDLLKNKASNCILPHHIHFCTDRIDVCFNWTNGDGEFVLCFTNNISQQEGGTHLIGFRAAITKAILPYVENEINNNRNIKVRKVISEDIRFGLQSVVSIKIQDPRFSAQVKSKLISPEARALVEDFVFPLLTNLLESNPKERDLIIKRVILSAAMREAANQKKDSEKKKVIDAFTVLSGNFSDCQSENPVESELILVEGPSAGGSAKMGRNNKTQAILALKGKPLNTERATLNKSLSCDEIISMIAAIGAGVCESFNIDKLRYHKIIIMTDADVDGLHIKCLLITFFMKFFPEIVKRSHLYIAMTPLFKATQGKSVTYIKDEFELDKFLFNRILNNNPVKINGNILSFDEMKTFVTKCREFVDYINFHTNSINRKIVSIAYANDIFNNQNGFIDIISKILDGQSKITTLDSDSLQLEVISIYGKNSYIIMKPNINWSLNFPIEFDDQIFYDPIEFIKSFQHKSTSGIHIQRYKGLGEMNPEELAETSLDVKNRNLAQIIVDSDNYDEVIENIKNVMGNDSDRKEFVLFNLERIFNLNLRLPILSAE